MKKFPGLLFRKELNKLNKTGARMFDSIYHMTLKLLKNRIFGVKTSRFCRLLCNVIKDDIKYRSLYGLSIIVKELTF